MTKFKQQLSFWYYKDVPRNYRGFHVAGEAGSCLWLNDILTKTTFHAVDLQLMRVNNGMLRVPNCAAKAVDFLYAKIELDKMQRQPILLTNNHPTLNIVFNETGRHSFVKGIHDIQEGRGDYCVGEDGNELWFWWMPVAR